MTTYSWLSAQSATWGTAADWTPAQFGNINGGDTALIAATGTAYTVTYNGSPNAIGNLIVNSGSATLAFNASTTLTVSTSTSLQAGTINLFNSGAVLNAGALTTAAGSTINIGAGAALTYNSGTVAGLIDIVGSTTLGSGSLILSGTIEVAGGTGTINFSGISGSGILEANGGTLLAAGSLANAPNQAVIANNAASKFITTGQLFNTAQVSISFKGANGAFEYNDSASDTHVTFNTAGLNAGASKTVPTNFMEFGGEVLTVSSGGTGSAATGSVVLSNNDTLALTGITGFGAGSWAAKTVSDGAGGTEVFLASVCYAAGTQILTIDGEKPVERLRPAEKVITIVNGRPIEQTIKWVGRRRLDIASHPRPENIAPICIERGAFADNVPHRDLYVSPDHGISCDDKLISARQLVNGTTIRSVTERASVEYYHIELDTHAILLAEGLPAESYLDTGNRGFFANGGVPLVLHPDPTDPATRLCRERASCQPFVWDEATVRPVWQRLAARADALGRTVPTPATTQDPAVHVVVHGRTPRALHIANDLHIFALPANTTEFSLVSHACAPNAARPWLEDRRRLGVYVERIALNSANEITEIPLDHPNLSRGWWAAEQNGAALRRWTDGSAIVPVPRSSAPTIVSIRASNSGMAYVVGPTQLLNAASIGRSGGLRKLSHRR